MLQQKGALDENYNLSLADGSKYDIGKDGSTQAYNVDLKGEMSHQAIGWANPLAEVMSGGDPKLRENFAGYFANAGMSNAKTLDDVKANILAIAEKTGMSQEQIQEALKASTTLSEPDKAAMMNGVGTLYDAKNHGQTGSSEAFAQSQAVPPGETPANPNGNNQVVVLKPASLGQAQPGAPKQVPMDFGGQGWNAISDPLQNMKPNGQDVGEMPGMQHYAQGSDLSKEDEDALNDKAFAVKGWK